MSTQEFLNNIWDHDKHGFLKDVDSWSNHRPMLLLGLHLTEGLITELGSGEGSTWFIRNYRFNGETFTRPFNSYDSNREWAEKMRSIYIQDWDSSDMWIDKCGLLFVDNAPGEYRKVAIEKMKDKADVIIVHDTELNSAGDYGFEPVFKLFKYVLHYNRTGGGAGATALSNKIDLHQFSGHSLGGFKFEL